MKAISIIDATDKWGARVVYGDTDSVFIYLKGKTKEQAFRIGQDIADTITAMNPPPVKLKFEKVTQPVTLKHELRYLSCRYICPVFFWQKKDTWASNSKALITGLLLLMPRGSKPSDVMEFWPSQK